MSYILSSKCVNGGHISPAPQMMLLRLMKWGGSTNKKNTKRIRALMNELYFGIHGLKWGTVEMDPKITDYIEKRFR